ncbi:MAG: hypothetical protein OQK55_11505 [Thermoanaerobaculales bacterium]|nr:hypothetical protein [Thermoanaerobaculales bacterium]
MSISSGRCCLAIIVMLGSLAVAPKPAEAQREFEPLFDKFNFQVEGSWIDISTEIRLDSELLGRGTTLNFESELGLASSKTIPTLAFQWQIARKHRVGVRWQDISRSSNSQALTDIQWGDEVIPIDASIALGFDITQTFVDYAYYPWVKERWAAGFGLGFRWMSLQATLAWESSGVAGEGTSEAKGSGPLPYLYFEYRRLFSENWRFIAGLGWLQVKISDIDGGQRVGHVGIEYLAGKRWSFGVAGNLSSIDVDWKGLQTESGESLYTGAINMDINDVSVFARVRF